MSVPGKAGSASTSTQSTPPTPPSSGRSRRSLRKLATPIKVRSLVRGLSGHELEKPLHLRVTGLTNYVVNSMFV